MILPGHLAASLLTHRYLKVDLHVALVAAIVPDVVDKLLHYVLRLTPSSRVIMHSVVGWLGATLLVGIVGFVRRRDARWALSWFAAHGAHLLCDSPLVGGRLPFLYPFRTYDFGSPEWPLAYLFDLERWPIRMLVAEAALVGLTFYLSRRWRRTETPPGSAPLDAGATTSPKASGHGIDRSRRRRLLALVSVMVLALIAPALWFPTVRPVLSALSLIVLLLGWVALSLLTGVAWPRSPYDPALALLLVMAAVGAVVSHQPDLTLPKATSLLLGLALYGLILRFAAGRRGLTIVLATMLGLALLFSAVGGLSGIRGSKAIVLESWVDRLPRLLNELPEAQRGRVSMNQLGGALLYVLPLALAVSLAPRDARGPEGRIFPWERGAAVLVGMLLLVTLLFTQSRGAWVGAAIGILCFVALRWPWGKWVFVVLSLAALTWWLVWGRDVAAPFVLEVLTARTGPLTPFGGLSLRGRLGIWTRAISYIKSSPLYGGGWGTFRMLDGDPASGRSLFDIGTPHAHNTFLQVAYDMGLTGLVAYLALVVQAARMSWRVYRHATGLSQALAVGALTSLLSYHVYGLTDVVALGSKPGVLWWGLLALIAAVYRYEFPIGVPTAAQGHSRPPSS